jgi:tight adherence protein C
MITMSAVVAGSSVALALAVVSRPRRRFPQRVDALTVATSHYRGASRTALARWRSEVLLRVRETVRRPSRRRRLDGEVRETLPDVIDLLRLATSAGLNLQLAVGTVADVVDGPFAVAMSEVRRQNDLGVRLVDALDALLTLGDAVRPLHLAMVSAARDGAALAGPLGRAADEARMVRRRKAEERARRLPVQLLFPLVMCILPAFVLLTVVPLLAGSLGSLSI